MSIYNFHGKWYLICDVHQEDDVEEEFDSFDEAVDYARDEGWTNKWNPIAKEWENICPDCKQGGD